jgi:hypothetical protein
MRFPIAAVLAALAVSLAPSTSNALPTSEGKVVRGSYLASGKISTGSITIRYLKSRVNVNPNGRVRGRVLRQVFSRGALIQQNFVTLRGKCRSLTVRARKGTFSAPAVLKIDGSVFRGEFTGLSDPSNRVSRFFRGRINGDKKSSLLLRSR